MLEVSCLCQAEWHLECINLLPKTKSPKEIVLKTAVLALQITNILKPMHGTTQTTPTHCKSQKNGKKKNTQFPAGTHIIRFYQYVQKTAHDNPPSTQLYPAA
jgi:hypothetical protein